MSGVQIFLPILTGLRAVADRYDAYIVDLWGVLHGIAPEYPHVFAPVVDPALTTGGAP